MTINDAHVRAVIAERHRQAEHDARRIRAAAIRRSRRQARETSRRVLRLLVAVR